MVSLRDLRKHYFNRKKLKIKDVMNKKPFVLHSDSGLEEIVKTLGLLNSSTVPYVDEHNKFVFMIDLNKIYKDIAMIDRYKII
jgi:predicted transcriptional regulator